MFVNESLSPSFVRLAWCHGDLGIGLSLWKAGVITGNELWKREALEIFNHASKRRDIQENHIKDGCVCHGTASAAHVFRRMWWETRQSQYHETAEYWIKQTLNFAKHNDGVAGYKAWLGDITTAKGGNDEFGLLSGVTGIGLALMSALSDEPLHWDECLLMS